MQYANKRTRYCSYTYVVHTYIHTYNIWLLIIKYLLLLLGRLNYKHSKEEVAEMNALSGIERVRRSLCLNEHLLPDEDTRVFTNVRTYVRSGKCFNYWFSYFFPTLNYFKGYEITTYYIYFFTLKVGEYLTFINGPGYNQRHKVDAQTLRKKTLFGPFLNDGRRGDVMFTFLWEVCTI